MFFCCCQAHQIQMWSVKYVPKARSLTRPPPLTPASPTQSEWRRAMVFPQRCSRLKLLTLLFVLFSCNGRAVLREGNTESDNVCEPYTLTTTDNHKKSVGTTPSTSTTTVAPSSGSTSLLRSTTQSASVSEEPSTYLITSLLTPPPDSSYGTITD